MRTPAKLAIAAAALVVVGYPVASWYWGKEAETLIADSIAAAQEQFPGAFTVELTAYERGIFHSTATHTVTFPSAKDLKITVRSNITHGPFAGGSFALAAAENETTFENLPPQAAALLADKLPLKSYLVVYSEDHHRAGFTLPALDTEDAEKGIAPRLAIGGLTIEWDITGTVFPLSEMKLEKARVKLSLPSLSTEQNGSGYTLSDLEADGDYERVFDDIDWFFLGRQRFRIADFSYRPGPGAMDTADFSYHPGSGATDTEQVRMKGVVYDADSGKKGDFIASTVHIGIDTLDKGGQSYSAVRADLTADHFHARAVGKIQENRWSMGENMFLRNFNVGGAGKKPDAAQDLATGVGTAAIVSPIFTVLENAPVITLDRVSFDTPQGPVTASARVTVEGFKQSDIADTDRWLKKIDISGEISLPLEFANKSGKSPEQAAQRIDGLVKNGYIVLENGILKTKAVFRNGQLTLNDKPFDPQTLSSADEGGEKPQTGATEEVPASEN